jgi:hypothetical protein
MALQGVDRGVRDIDLFLATAHWFRAAEELSDRWNLWLPSPDDPKCRCDPAYLWRDVQLVGCPMVRVEMYAGWGRRGDRRVAGDIDVTFWIHNAVMVGGIPCVPLNLLLGWKEQTGRAKDAIDAGLIRRALRADG